MDHKTKRIQVEMEQVKSGDHGRLLWPVMVFTDAVSKDVSGKQILVTGILRTPEEQVAIYKTINKQRAADNLPIIDPIPSSVHEYFRGFDFRWWIYTFDELQQIIKTVNDAFQYGGRFRVLAYHKHGTAPHAHGQVPNGGVWLPGN